MTISDIGHSDKYSGYHIKIISKLGGEICQKTFKFDDFLEFDTSRDSSTHVWYNSYGPKFDWYINTPMTVKPMVDVIMEFINSFKISTETSRGGSK
jgi:hypothetical protein